MLTDFVGAVRRNHALEHATVTILLSRIKPVRMVARASRDGFFVWGKVDGADLERAARDALSRLKGGESYLAVTPLCGTNIAVGGALAGAAVLLTARRGRELSSLPNAMTAAMFGIVAAQPLGRLVQERVTTSPDLSGMEILRVRPLLGRLHKVETRWNHERDGR